MDDSAASGRPVLDDLAAVTAGRVIRTFPMARHRRMVAAPGRQSKRGIFALSGAPARAQQRWSR